ncbi:MAG: zf-HC2 domain-containing protein [Vicinamibacteria bacterium]
MTHGTVRPSACLDAETLGAFAEGRLAGAERDAAVRHLATCRRCHEVFASSVQILEDEGLLPVATETAPAPALRRGTPTIWFSAAAAALVAAVLFVQRAPVAVPRVAEASPAPLATASPAPNPAASPFALRTASLPPEAIEALRMLGGFTSPYEATPSAAFAPSPRGRAVALGIQDVDAAARALAEGGEPAEPAGAVDEWRKVGRVLEASRLALFDPSGRAQAFFASPWARLELEQASHVLHAADVRDARWVEDVRRDGPVDARAAQRLLERLDALLRSLR